METTPSTPATAAPAAEWAKVELLGHRTRYGLAREVERYGTKMLRIDVFGPGSDTPILTEFYAGQALFGYRPCTEECARAWASDRWNLPEEVRPALPAPDNASVHAEFDVLDGDARPADISDDLTS
ncbi:hypothetical protein D3869_01610 [Azospirillum brasilense]|uniref:Uncharacterized protein n=1 Tax=Azospirillum brasilense TaxID=192 RepID=A0A4D8R9Y9_AZOBR|nr:hypothetical protein [Azospirillum brasilense]QCO14032.1 hypothetical protein D3869_01610 [Azospirillum brasilense]